MIKKASVIILITIFTIGANAQKLDQIFYKYAKNIVSEKNLSYDIVFNKKNIFETDTLARYATVKMIKNGNRASFLHIKEKGDNNIEFILKNDSAWVIDNKSKVRKYIGGRTDVGGISQMSFLPLEIFYFDTINIQSPSDIPYKFSKNEGRSNIYILNTTENLPEGLEKVVATLSIDTVDLRIKKYQLTAIFSNNVGEIEQEYIFRNYSNEKIDDSVLDRFKSYSYTSNNDEKVSEAENSVENIEVNTIDFSEVVFTSLKEGTATRLPEQGLVFIDAWYVGCFPCMRAAPIVEKLHVKYKDKVAFYSINEMDNDVQLIESFAKKMNVTIPILISTKSKYILNSAKVMGYPIFILYDARTKEILMKYSGYNENLEENLEKGLMKAVKNY